MEFSFIVQYNLTNWMSDGGKQPKIAVHLLIQPHILNAFWRISDMFIDVMQKLNLNVDFLTYWY